MIDLAIPIKEVESALETTAQCLKCNIISTGFEKIMNYPDHIGQGRIRVINLNPDLYIEEVQLSPAMGIHQKFSQSYSMVRFTFFIEGNGELNWLSPHDPLNRHKISSFKGNNTITYYPEVQGALKLWKKVKHHQITISISPSLLKKFFGNDFFGKKQYFNQLKKIEEQGSRVNFCRYGKNSSKILTTIFQILNCSFKGGIGKMFLEGKALELIAYQLDQIFADSPKRMDSPSLSGKDIERIYFARDILCKNIEEPPSLRALARMAGMNCVKLNQGFKEIFGVTVFACLRGIRLEQAKHLMETRQARVTEAAYAVGYKSIPSFSRAFSQYFGLNPTACCRKHPDFTQ